MTERKLIPELQAHLEEISLRLGKLGIPVHACIAGGMAVNYHTGYRMPSQVEMKWSHRVPIPPEMLAFPIPDPHVEDETIIVSLDGLSDVQGSYPPGWEQAAPEISRAGQIIIHVMTPLDLAVSMIARSSDLDREDIKVLAQAGLIRSADLEERAAEALRQYAGDTTFIMTNIRDAVDLVRAVEASPESSPAEHSPSCS